MALEEMREKRNLDLTQCICLEVKTQALRDIIVGFL